MPPKKSKENMQKSKENLQKGNRKDPKKQSSEFTLINEGLNQEITALKAENEKLRMRLVKVSQKLLESKDEAWKTARKIQNDTDLLSLGDNILLEIISDLVVKKKEYEDSIEVQVEQLESRVTEMSTALARYATKCRAYESGLKGFLACDNLNAVKDLTYHLMIVAGEAFHSCEANDPERDPEKLFRIEGITDRPGSATSRVINNARKLNLIPPATKHPGITLIKDMVPELLFYIMKELSVEKASGADWFTLGCRVGIDQAMLDDWRSSQLSNPAGRVFTEWTVACPATVRLLYRHLMSPQMRCTILCKRIADFYCVD